MIPFKETVTALMILCKTTKAMVGSSDGDTDFFIIVAGVFQGDTLVPFLLILSNFTNVNRSNKS